MREEQIKVVQISELKRPYLPPNDLPEETVIALKWYDERQGRGEVASAAELRAVLRHFQLDDVPLANNGNQPPLTVENEQFSLSCRDDSFPCRVTIRRKPQGPVQAYVWQFAAETRMARVLFQNDELGVLFLDENAFVPFNQLDYSAETRLRIL
ncbi:MAG: hypothetical protein AAF614_18300 [Chloroflexota bacterium]